MAEGALMGASSQNIEICANILDVEVDSPAFDAGFEPGCKITGVDGMPIRDMIDWRWLTTDNEIEVSYIDLDGEAGSVVLVREPEEDWGFTFDEAVFDGVRTCRNACTFCFMRQLPEAMRSTLTLRDDDYRLSFLEGTFSTLTNVGDADIARIVEQHISPLRLSLHAIDANVRRSLIGKHEHAGIEALQKLLDFGIEFDAQIVLVPEVNDGKVLDETLAWAYERPGIRNIGIVPLGFTKYQDDFSKSFDDSNDAMRILKQVQPYQRQAFEERGIPWVYPADEFYCNAYGDEVIDNIPDDNFYGDFSMFEDGIGIVRSAIDSWEEACASGVTARLASALDAANMRIFYICGESMSHYGNQVVERCGLAGKFEFAFAKNRFFGGNVNVTGLLCGCDLAFAIKELVEGLQEDSADKMSSTKQTIIAIPDIVFNVDGVTLDDWTLEDIKAHVSEDFGNASGKDSPIRLLVASSNPLNYAKQLCEIAKDSDALT